MNEIIYQPRALKQLRKIPAHRQIREKIALLKNMPDCVNVKALQNHIYI
ncbi:mRNA-degrading endonuclease RelE of RelBE toxin-antitoxin system [Neisseria sp. HSC-16F19]|nr:mRNA-degrading endonuclease RelE of RelBE toxin-antitoxin system [Neisseria sp. HSC-16F19]